METLEFAITTIQTIIITTILLIFTILATKDFLRTGDPIFGCFAASFLSIFGVMIYLTMDMAVS